MSKIRPKQVPTDYFPRAEFEQIIAATHAYGQGPIPARGWFARTFDTENGLSGHRVLSFLQDREGGLWVVTPDGVDYFRDYTATSFAPDNQVFDDRARAVAARGDDLYLGSDSLVQLHSGQIHCVRDEHGEPLHDVQFLFSDSANNLWIGAGNPVGTGDPRQDRGGHECPGTKSCWGLWVGGALHGLFWFHDGRFERVLSSSFDDRVGNLLQEPNGALWMVTPRGFVRYANGKAKLLSSLNGLPCDGAVNIQDDGHGAL